MKPATCRDEFTEELAQCRSLREYAIDHIEKDEVRFLTLESAQSRAFRAYENFIENVFLSFMTGEPSVSGAAVGRYVTPPSREHARRMLQGKARFLDWADPSTVIERGEYYFYPDGHLSVAVTQSWNMIDWMRKIRDHIAHNSVESAAQYRKVVAALLLIEPPVAPRPGELLQMRPRRGPFKGREVLASLFSDLEAFVAAAVG
ncbi:hypothetical protein [Cellulomonas sp. ES6]|uniref:hypothetical protein n=1 Tax=Cellulomonas sp. ES6 TaxID=3039384 RepID=UPI0024B68049|nr:hypothetical protein [Cellulomonas sp. ES6]WHP19294.1 hypothetical protein P9841_09485 [Cellulomonas sp. ES6]